MCTAMHFVRESLDWSETDRKLTLPRGSCDTVTVAQSVDKNDATCSENGHPDGLHRACRACLDPLERQSWHLGFAHPDRITSCLVHC